MYNVLAYVTLAVAWNFHGKHIFAETKPTNNRTNDTIDVECIVGVEYY